ncbi:Iron ABC transporter permease OS=Streptomyces antimycoticus OX=68175 GN=SSPO_007950 PE=3 SV=1 [Streptomyces antimycoticus]
MTAVALFVAVGLVLAVTTLPALNLLNLGDDVARGLGVNIALSRTIGIAAITLLAGAATAACGPIAFLGPTCCHVAGDPDRAALPLAGAVRLALLGACPPALRHRGSLGAVRPGELDAGVVVALLGAPFFAALVWLGKFKSA